MKPSPRCWYAQLPIFWYPDVGRKLLGMSLSSTSPDFLCAPQELVTHQEVLSNLGDIDDLKSLVPNQRNILNQLPSVQSFVVNEISKRW